MKLLLTFVLGLFGGAAADYTVTRRSKILKAERIVDLLMEIRANIRRLVLGQSSLWDFEVSNQAAGLVDFHFNTLTPNFITLQTQETLFADTVIAAREKIGWDKSEAPLPVADDTDVTQMLSEFESARLDFLRELRLYVERPMWVVFHEWTAVQWRWSKHYFVSLPSKNDS